MFNASLINDSLSKSEDKPNSIVFMNQEHYPL